MGLRTDIRDENTRPLSTFELVQSLLARLGAQDAEGLTRLFAPQVEWRATDPTSSRWRCGVRTRREIESFFLATFSALGLEGLTVRRLLVDGEDAVVLGTARWRTVATTAVHEADFVLSVSVHRGVVDEYWLMQETVDPPSGSEPVRMR
ncbi:nuclear transport factor 2 family protein [Amycolatopsis cihanbeyliensis]|uniref:nuclear transport factor 2 family protein n=1 Tax=Amycolatopsis cihanbeyliensis TaxID=1128664 RepID=UPI001476CBC1|nr:nuclear transport factor 2 family protein [Amycolatopsis cihanbeyliensis]